ncbi:MAG: RNA recognition motif [candidate division WS2 bacterium ADurb.Bin280]|uniref:RNA recognition motif n=1 Tax=candidate division WS2 bacterium ADurb.Bin280 TaxID=1852829 RepID=A0A1V5SFI4_9BACT|nr:MAG: RNA recognition motif [candidate division WS2 bacterium ADurb.Bin280]
MENEKRLFIGNLPYSVDDRALEEIFSKAGKVESAVVITQKETGRSKGFGFVEMATPEEAKAAIEMYNDQEVEGRKIVVSIARPKQPREE